MIANLPLYSHPSPKKVPLSFTIRTLSLSSHYTEDESGFPVSHQFLYFFFSAGADYRWWRRRSAKGSGEESVGGVCGPVRDRWGWCRSDKGFSLRFASRELPSQYCTFLLKLECLLISSCVICRRVGCYKRVEEVPPWDGQRVFQSQAQPSCRRRLWIHEAEPRCLWRDYYRFFRPCRWALPLVRPPTHTIC